jgi:hypothetical protein
LYNTHLIALVETDQAAIVRAAAALDDLQAIGLILCHRRWTVDLAERYQSNVQDIAVALTITRRWMSAIHEATP